MSWLAGAVDLWWWRTDVPGADLAALLDGAERSRMEGIGDAARRQRFTAAHAVARLIVAGYLAVPPHAVRWVRTPNGKPEVAGAPLRVNLSHSAALAALAVTGGRPVGVDVQRMVPEVDPVRSARRYFPPDEAEWVAAAAGEAGRRRRFTMLWARKEACVKAAGGRLMQGMPLPVRDTVVAGALGTFRVRDVRAPAGFRGAVAVAGADHVAVRPRWWPSR